MKSSEFKDLVMPYSSRLYRMAFLLTGNRQEAEDIVQEVYLKLWNMRSDLANYNSIEALSIRITRNLCLDLLRRRKTSIDVMNREQMKGVENPPSPDQVYETRERAVIVNNMIESLPEPQRSLVYLRHIEGKDYEEISQMMNMNINAIRVSISRARKQLREIFEKQYLSWKT